MSSIIPENQSSERIDKLQEDFLELSLLFDMTRELNYATDIFSLAECFLNFLRDKIKAKSIAFYSLDDNKYSLISCEGVESPYPAEFSNAGEGIWQIINEGKPFRVVDDQEKDIYSHFFSSYHLQNLHSYVWLPVLNEGKITAITAIGKKEGSKPYSKADIKVLEKACAYLAPAINRVKTQEIKERNINYLQKSLHNISILYSLGQAINFIDDLKKLLKIIIDKAIQTIGAEKGSLMLYDPSSNELVVKVVYGLPDKEIEEKINDGIIECTRIKIGEGIAGEAFSTKKPIITNLGSFDPKFKQSTASRVSSILCVPLIIKGEPIGVINITNKLGNEFFNHDDMDFMSALANQAAIAINNAQLYELATKDGLTKLYIYRHFQNLLEAEIKRSDRYKHCVSLLMMDIDNFKMINDTYGHQIGDEILRSISHVISSTCRKIDMPSRYGGEEFALILPETGIQNTRNIAERLRKRISDISVYTDDNIRVMPTISIGISSYPDLSSSQESLIGTADKALYFAKSNGKNCVAEFHPEGCQIFSSGNGSANS